MTNRVPIRRPKAILVSTKCIEAFREWKRLEDKCTCDETNNEKCAICERRNRAYWVVISELGLKPWETAWDHNSYIYGLLVRASAEFQSQREPAEEEIKFSKSLPNGDDHGRNSRRSR